MYRFRIADPQFLPHLKCDIDITVERGELLALTGENGLGKTTLLNRFRQESTLSMTLVEQRAMDFFYDRTLGTVKKIYMESLNNSSREYFNFLWTTFGLDKKENRYQSSLSGGESQALKLCLSLCLESDICLLDEPSQFLDESARAKLSDVLSDLLEKQRAIILVEHDLSWLKFPVKGRQLEIKEGTLSKGRSWNT
jgi:ABC-type multidrug transport system ATPase subunit